MNRKFYFEISIFLLALLTMTIAAQAATITVTNKNNSGTGSLRQAALNANTSGNASDTINFATNVRGTILLTGFEIELNKLIGTNLTINGPGTDVLSIESNLAFRVFRVQLGNIKISGKRISGGSASGFPAGGGIFVSEGANLMLENCSIAGNQGGGIATMSDSTLTINNSMISGNDGGGIDGAGGLSVSNSTVSDNFGTDNVGIRWLNGAVTLTNVTVSGNRGIDSGGININGATTTILNSTIAENFGGNGVAAHTGGLRIESGTVNLKNTIIADNQAFTPDINGTISSQGNNLIRNRTGGAGFVASDLPNNTNPQLDGFVGVVTTEAINRFQKFHFGSSDSRVELGGQTFSELKKYDPLPFSAPVVAPDFKSSISEKMDPSKMNRGLGKSVEGGGIKAKLYAGVKDDSV